MKKFNHYQNQWRYEQADPPKYFAYRVVRHDSLLAAVIKLSGKV
jgi:hypothetical protein